MIATLALAVTLLAPAWGQSPEPPVLDTSAVQEVDESSAELEARVEELSQRLAEQEAEIQRLRTQLDEPRVSPRVVHEEHLESAPEDLVAGPERVHFGGPVQVEAGEVIAEAVSFGGDVEVAGHVTGDATSFGGSVSVLDGGRVDGDAVSFGGVVEVRPGGVVRGDRVGLGSGAGVQGFDAGKAQIHHAGRGLLSSLYHRLVFLLSFLGAGVLIVGLFPDRVVRVAQALEARPLRSLLVGLFTTLALGFASILFMITIVGIPIGVVLIAVLGISWLAGFVGLCQALGDRLPFLPRPTGHWVTFLVGALLVSFVGVLPVVGWIAVGAASVLGMGAALTSRFGSSGRV